MALVTIGPLRFTINYLPLMVTQSQSANCESRLAKINCVTSGPKAGIPTGGGPQMEVKWTKISMKQDFEGNVVVIYENDEMILEVTEGSMLVGGIPQ